MNLEEIFNELYENTIIQRRTQQKDYSRMEIEQTITNTSSTAMDSTTMEEEKSEIADQTSYYKELKIKIIGNRD